MNTLTPVRVSAKSTQVNPDEVWSLATVTSVDGALAYGRMNGRHGWKPAILDTTPFDLIDHIWVGYAEGLAECQARDLAAELAELERFELEADGALPDPQDLADDIRDHAAGIRGKGAAARFLRRELMEIARSVEALACRSWEEYDARTDAMGRS